MLLGGLHGRYGRRLDGGIPTEVAPQAGASPVGLHEAGPDPQQIRRRSGRPSGELRHGLYPVGRVEPGAVEAEGCPACALILHGRGGEVEGAGAPGAVLQGLAPPGLEPRLELRRRSGAIKGRIGFA